MNGRILVLAALLPVAVFAQASASKSGARGTTVTQNSVIADAPLTGTGIASSHLACTVASGSLAGCLSASDWTTFNAKQAGPLTGDVTTSGAAATLANTAVSPGTYGGTTAIPIIAIDSKGRITSAVNAGPSLDVAAISSGTFSQARGGTGAGALTCATGTMLTSNGTAYSCAVPTSTNQHAEGNSSVSCSTPVGSTITVGATGTYLIGAYARPVLTLAGDLATLSIQKNAVDIAGTVGQVVDNSGTGAPSSTSQGVWGPHVIATLTASDVIRIACTSTGNVVLDRSLFIVRLGP